MRRVAVTLLLLAVGLAVPVAILVVRALESAAAEEANRHRSLAERAFDEMEDSLSRLLEAEEARPFAAYRFYEELVPSQAPGGRPVIARRSSLADPPEHPFVIGYFQIDPDGSLHTPRVPRDPDLAARLGDFTPSAEVTGLARALREAWDRAAEMPTPVDRRGRRVAAADGDELEVPTSSISEEAVAKPQSRQIVFAKKDAKLEPEEQDSYDVLRSLNRASKRRLERKQKVTLEQAPSVPSPYRSNAPQSFADSAELRRDPASGRIGALREAASPEPILEGLAARGAPLRSPRTVRVARDPMVGRAAPGDRLLLYRTVVVGEQGYRQGLLVDWRRLGDWLERQVIAPSGLGESARVAFFAEAQPLFAEAQPLFAEAQPLFAEALNAADPTRYVYQHRFAEPFEAFGVELGLPVLPGTRGTGPIYALAALLALVAAGGLVAVYRMVSVVVHFAERRSRFAASVSHELKTPLTSIRMYAEMLRDGLVPNERKREEYYHTITDESERLSRLIDNVLDFSRLEKGEYEADAHLGAIVPVVREAVAKLAPHAERQGFRLAVEADDDLPDVSFDRDAIIQVVFNLVDNALKYARGATRKEIIVSCRTGGGDASSVEISVRDFGPGVPRADLARIFEPFFRREDQLTRATKGTGIGLALVKELVESQAGRIHAENAEGGGFRVGVRLASWS